MLDTGFVKIDRKIIRWEWYKDIPVRVLFEHLIYTANYYDNKERLVEIKRGQRLTSIAILSYETGLTPKQVRGALIKLQKTNEIEIKATNKFSLITIYNYDKYQYEKTMSGQAEGQAEGQTKGKQEGIQRATNKEYKEIKNNNSVCVSARTENEKQLEELKNDRQYQETYAMQNHLTLEQVGQLIEAFGQHLILGGDEAHRTKAEFISHFRDWARYRIESQNKTNYRQNGNQSDKYTRRRGTAPSPLEEFNGESF